MKMKIFGKKKTGKGLIVTGGILAAIGTIGAIASKLSKDDNCGNINVCENDVELSDEFLEEENEKQEQETELV